MSTLRPTQTGPADIITYRLGQKLVYVKPADSYEQALDYAQKEFPDELADVPRNRVSFNIFATMNGERRPVRISESAWVASMSRLLRGEVVDVVVCPLRLSDTKDEPPQYLEVPNNESNSLRKSRSTPSSRTHCRQSSPSGRSDRNSSRPWFWKF